MPLKLRTLPRAFEYGSLQVPDPNPKLNPDEVKKLLAGQYPELINAAVEGPAIKKDLQVYTFVKSIGTKG